MSENLGQVYYGGKNQSMWVFAKIKKEFVPLAHINIEPMKQPPPTRLSAFHSTLSCHLFTLYVRDLVSHLISSALLAASGDGQEGFDEIVVYRGAVWPTIADRTPLQNGHNSSSSNQADVLYMHAAHCMEDSICRPGINFDSGRSYYRLYEKTAPEEFAEFFERYVVVCPEILNLCERGPSKKHQFFADHFPLRSHIANFACRYQPSKSSLVSQVSTFLSLVDSTVGALKYRDWQAVRILLVTVSILNKRFAVTGAFLVYLSRRHRSQQNEIVRSGQKRFIQMGVYLTAANIFESILWR